MKQNKIRLLILYGIIGSVVFSIIAFIITLISYTIILHKNKIKLKSKKPIQIYAIFFISLLSASFLESILLKDIYLGFIRTLDLLFFQYFNPLSLGLFFIIFIFLSIYLKIITISDVELIESFFIRDSFSHKNIRKILSFSKRFLRA